MATMTNPAAPTKVLSQQKSAFAGNGRALAPARVARVAARNVAARAEVKEIHMPALSSTMTEGKISEVRVRALGLGLGLDRGQDLRG